MIFGLPTGMFNSLQIKRQFGHIKQIFDSNFGVEILTLGDRNWRINSNECGFYSMEKTLNVCGLYIIILKFTMDSM